MKFHYPTNTIRIHYTYLCYGLLNIKYTIIDFLTDYSNNVQKLKDKEPYF